MPTELPTLQRSSMPRQRLSSTAVMERQPGSLRLDAGRLDHFGPFLGFVGDELAEIGRRADKRRASKVGKPRLHLGIGEAGVDLLVELVEGFDRRAIGRADAVPGARLVTRQEL